MGVLRFRLFGVPTDIQPGFWILPLYLGARSDPSFTGIALVVGIVLVSLLVHEMGHAAVARSFGQAPRISLHMLGGTTSWQQTTDLSRLRHALVSLAGPFAGFALGLVTLLVQVALAGEARIAQGGVVSVTLLDRALAILFWVNVGWGAINLLPVLPFDGGQVLAAALGPKRRRLTALVSLIFGVIVAVVMLARGWMLGAVLFFIGGIANFVAAERAASAQARPEALASALERARAALDAAEYIQAGAIARAVFDAADLDEMKREAIEILGWALLMSGDATGAREALALAPDSITVDPFLTGAVHEATGQAAAAAEVLEGARRRGDRRPQVAGLLVRSLLEAEKFDEAARLAGDIFEDTDDEDIRKVAHQALAGGAREGAGRLLRRLFDRTEDPLDAYDAARAFALGDRLDDAIDALTTALAAGHPHPERARSDEDLAALRGDQRFEALLARSAPEGS